MKITIAPDSFKESLSSTEAAETMKKAISTVCPNAEFDVKPMADGGEGTLEAIARGARHKSVPVTATGPLGSKKETSYLITDSGTAVIEAAAIAGLMLVPPKDRDPDHITTLGIGEVIRHALDKGIRSFLIGIGGSSSNDGGFGMLQALGATFTGEAGKPVGSTGVDLGDVTSIDLTALDHRLKESEFRIACDVDNPLLGRNGASTVYGPQKGASASQIKLYETWLERYADLMEDELGASYRNSPGAGAAGGLGYAFLLLGSNLKPGAPLLASATGLETSLKTADLVLTGEGKTDIQTLSGKAPAYVAGLAAERNIPVFLISGAIEGDVSTLNDTFDACFSVSPGPISLEESLDRAEELLYETTTQIARVFKKAEASG